MKKLILSCLLIIMTLLLVQFTQAKSIFDKLVQRNIYVRYWDLPGIENKLRISVGTKGQNDTLLSALKEIVSA